MRLHRMTAAVLLAACVLYLGRTAHAQVLTLTFDKCVSTIAAPVLHVVLDLAPSICSTQSMRKCNNSSRLLPAPAAVCFPTCPALLFRCRRTTHGPLRFPP